MYQTAMRWLAPFLTLLLWGCPPPAKYAIDRPGLSCDRAARVAHRTMVTLGYTVTQMDEPSVDRAGTIAGTKTKPDGTTESGRVVIRCTSKGAVLQPVPELLDGEGLEPGCRQF